MKSVKISDCLSKMSNSYVFGRVAERKKEYESGCNNAEIIDLGIGDLKGPLIEQAANALVEASSEQRTRAFFRGYGPYEGYDFCRKAVCDYYFRSANVKISPSEVFIGDGAKSAIQRIMSLFDCETAVFSPAYPAYIDCITALGKKCVVIKRSEENDFSPDFGALGSKPRLVILCSPDNPTGYALRRERADEILKYCRKSRSVILFDAAYESYCGGDKIRSLYETEEMRRYVVEVGSLSKSACFTGLRVGWTIVPEEIADGKLKKTYSRVIAATYNGCPYVAQRAAQKALGRQADGERAALIGDIKQSAQILKKAFISAGFSVFGGEDAPYLWVKSAPVLSGEDAFEYFLTRLAIVVTPGEGFGKGCTSFFRVSALAGPEQAQAAVKRIKEHFAF